MVTHTACGDIPKQADITREALKTRHSRCVQPQYPPLPYGHRCHGSRRRGTAHFVRVKWNIWSGFWAVRCSICGFARLFIVVWLLTALLPHCYALVFLQLLQLFVFAFAHFHIFTFSLFSKFLFYFFFCLSFCYFSAFYCCCWMHVLFVRLYFLVVAVFLALAGKWALFMYIFCTRFSRWLAVCCLLLAAHACGCWLRHLSLPLFPVSVAVAFGKYRLPSQSCVCVCVCERLIQQKQIYSGTKNMKQQQRLQC